MLAAERATLSDGGVPVLRDVDLRVPQRRRGGALKIKAESTVERDRILAEAEAIRLVLLAPGEAPRIDLNLLAPRP